MDRTKASTRYVLLAVWLLSTVGLAWLVLRGHHTFDSSATLPALLALLLCTAALLWWLSSGAPPVPPHAPRTRRGRFALLLLLAILVLLALRAIVGPPLLFALPVIGLVVLAILRPRFSPLEMAYAASLALLAGIAGLGARWVTIPPWTWAGLQVALVFPGLLAGWAILRHTGLLQAGIGHSLWVADGWAPALRSFAYGIALATPWALGMIVLGSANQETWVQHWWQPLIAIQPGIAEEAWGRVLLVPLLFLALRPVARARTALAASLLVMAYWFAYLHTSGGLGALISTAMIGTLFALPTSYLWLRRGLETAIGFHFCLDFVKFVAAYLLNRGLWPS